jgi:DNA-binding MarR family transcriptional regulator
MDKKDDFDIRDFLPYLLALSAEEASLGFQRLYKDRYGMLRTEWRLLFHLGRYGDLTAKDVCDRARLHKTKVSRAVTALEAKMFVKRTEMEHDRRHEMLSLTHRGRRAFEDLCHEAQTYDARMMAEFTEAEQKSLKDYLKRLARL